MMVNLVIEQENEAIPVVLAIALRMAQLSFPEFIYTGTIISEQADVNDCSLCLFARNHQGEPLPNEALTIEILKVNEQRSITAEYIEQPNLPILWYGKHAVWMDGETGKTVVTPPEKLPLEGFCRGLLTRLREWESSQDSEL